MNGEILQLERLGLNILWLWLKKFAALAARSNILGADIYHIQIQY